MRRVTVWLMLLLGLLCLAGCARRSGSVTPADLATATPYVPPTMEAADDVSGDYLSQLCSYPWLDTYTMQYYVLSEDGTFSYYQDEDLTTRLSEGNWKLLKNSAGQLDLHMEVSGSEAFDLYELELYEQSIYAKGPGDFSYIWLLCDPEE